MRVLSIRPAAAAEGPAGLVATFDAEVAPGIKITRMVLKKNRDGDFRIFGPRVGAGAVAFFNPETSIKLTALATAALTGANSHDATS